MQNHYNKAITTLKNAFVYLNTKVTQGQSGFNLLQHLIFQILRP